MAVAVSVPLVVAAWIGLIVVPAWTSYGRWWERIAATFLTLYILATLIGLGAALGLGIIWSYDRFAG